MIGEGVSQLPRRGHAFIQRQWYLALVQKTPPLRKGGGATTAIGAPFAVLWARQAMALPLADFLAEVITNSPGAGAPTVRNRVGADGCA